VGRACGRNEVEEGCVKVYWLQSQKERATRKTKT
jgi:hypothetical protein